MKIIQCTAIILGLSIAPIALAHADRIIKLKEGKLLGLPETYSPAEFDTTTHRLRVGALQMKFSPYLQSLMAIPHDTTFTASWYHDSATLPPYLQMRISPKEKDFHFSILFDLNTLKLIHLTKTVRESQNSTRDIPIELTNKQKTEIVSSVTRVK